MTKIDLFIRLCINIIFMLIILFTGICLRETKDGCIGFNEK